MSIFNSFKNEDVKIEEVKESVSTGVSFGPVETDAYDATIKQAYVDYSKGGAMSVNLELMTSTGSLIRNTQWVTSGNAKGNKNYYTDKNGKNHKLPGAVLINDICMLAGDFELGPDTETEERPVMIYDFAQGKQVPQPKHVLVDLIGTKITLAIEKVIEDKKVNDGNGNYVPSGETREINEIVKAFCHDDKVTVTEKKGGLTEASYLTAWVEKNKGKVNDKSTGKTDAQVAAVSASPAQPEVPPAPKSNPGSLFG